VHCGALVFVAVFSFGARIGSYKITDLIIPLGVGGAGGDRPRSSVSGEVMQDAGTASPAMSPVFAKTA
jgi:hypothetical protein